MAQNFTKLEIQFHTSGGGAKTARRAMTMNKNRLPGPLRCNVRYLGVNEIVGGHAYPEVSKRLTSHGRIMAGARSCMSSVVRLRCLVGQSLVFNIGLAGMEVWVSVKKTVELTGQQNLSLWSKSYERSCVLQRSQWQAQTDNKC